MTRLLVCDRCGAKAPLAEGYVTDDAWAVIFAGVVHGPSRRTADVCPGCQTEAERAAIEEASRDARDVRDSPF
jgi:hypothetical protein